MPAPAPPWFPYLIECPHRPWYAGPNPGVAAGHPAPLAGKGARYTRANPPLRLLGSRPFPDRASASRAEWQIKRLPRERKLAFLLQTGPADLPA